MRGEGMFFNANNTATLNILVTNSNITTSPIVTSTFENLQVQAASGAANSADIVAKIENNTVAHGGDGAIPGFLAEAIRLSAGSSGIQTVQLEQGGQSLGTAVSTVLDAIHLATAQLLGSDLGPFVTYDDRLAQAARRAGVRVTAPR
jgi:predicted nucleic acid-binding protein